MVDLNVGQSGLSFTGCIAPVPLSAPVHSVEMALKSTTPRRYYYGRTAPDQSTDLLLHYTRLVADDVNDELNRNPLENASGCVINTCGWTKDYGLELLFEAIKCFLVDHIVVIDDPGLTANFTTELRKSVTVHELPRSTGVVVRRSPERVRLRDDKISQYFIGRPQALVNIYHHVHDFSDLHVYQVDNSTTYTRVTDVRVLKKQVLAVLEKPRRWDPRSDTSWTLRACAAYFVLVIGVKYTDNGCSVAIQSLLPHRLPDGCVLQLGRISHNPDQQ